MNDTHALPVLAVVCILSGVAVGYNVATSQLRQEAIEHNAAHYAAKTAEFTWNNAKEKQ